MRSVCELSEAQEMIILGIMAIEDIKLTGRNTKNETMEPRWSDLRHGGVKTVLFFSSIRDRHNREPASTTQGPWCRNSAFTSLQLACDVDQGPTGFLSIYCLHQVKVTNKYLQSVSQSGWKQWKDSFLLRAGELWV